MIFKYKVDNFETIVPFPLQKQSRPRAEVVIVILAAWNLRPARGLVNSAAA